MKKKYLFKCFFLLLISNLILFLIVDHFSRISERQEISTIYKKEFSRYIIYLQNKEYKATKTIMAGFIYADILEIAEKKDINDYKYICEAWNKELNMIIMENLKLDDNKNKLYFIGAKKLDKLCK